MTEKTWTTKDGREIPIKDMDDQHLLNAARMIYRNADACLQDSIEEGEKILPTLSGEQAQYAVEDELLRLQQMTGEEFIKEYPLYQWLLEEIEKRKLEV